MSETPVVISQPVNDEAEKLDEAALEKRDRVDIKYGLTVDEGSSSLDPDYDVVAVHGLSGNSDTTWRRSSGSSIWLKDKLFASKNVRIMEYDYDIDEASGAIYTRKGFRDAALTLLDNLMELRKPKEKAPTDNGSKDGPEGVLQDRDPQRPLIFVAHDIGGIVIKQALILASLDPVRFGSISSSTAAMIFFGCPHRHLNSKDMEENLTRLLFLYGKPNRHNALRAIKGLSDSIIEINASFTDSKLLIHPSITNVFSTVLDPVEQIFDKFTATLNIPFENRILSNKPHDGLVVESDDYIRSIGDVLGALPCPLDISTSLSQYLPIILTQASPVYPSTTTNDPLFPDPEVSWIKEDETFLKWLARKDTSILHVYGTERITKSSEYIFHYIDSSIAAGSDHSVLYFQFQKNDARFNSIHSMLSTFLAQIISHYTNLEEWVVRGFEQLILHRSWTDKDLYQFWVSLRSSLLINGITYVIVGIELCDDSKNWFLDELVALSKCSEARFKVVLTGKGRQEVLSGLPAIDLDEKYKTDASKRDEALNGIVDFEVMQLLQRCPQYYSVEQKLREALSGCGEDFRRRRLIIDWLNFANKSGTKLATKNRLEGLSPVTLANVVKMIMESIPREREPWARRIIAWVFCAIRPLSSWELQLALILGEDDEALDLEDTVFPSIKTEIESCFGTMLYFIDTEIRCGHPDLRDVFRVPAESAVATWYHLQDETEVHKEITASCLRYLSLPEIQKRAEDFYDRNKDQRQHAVIETRFDFLSYATQYWPNHYKLSLSNGVESLSLTLQVTKFLEHTAARNAWAKAYWTLSNPITRSLLPRSSAMSAFSALGLEDLVSRFIDTRDQHEQSFNEECSGALIEAARNGHPHIVRLLLKYSTEADLRFAITVADSSTVLELLQYASALVGNFDFIPGTTQPDPLSKAAWLGLTDVVEYLIQAGAEVNPQKTLHGMSPLHLAARNNHANVVKALIAANALLDTTTLKTACIYGHPNIVRLLIDAKVTFHGKESRDDVEWEPLQYACVQGHHQIAKLLLDAGADANCGKEDGDKPLYKAAQNGHLECCRTLLDHGADPEPLTVESIRSPLHLSFDGDHLDICQLLLEKGANPNWKSDSKSPILHLAVATGNIKLVELLLDRDNLNIDIEDDSSWAKPTALSLAAERGSKEIVSLLIKRGAAKVNHSGAPESMPIYVAAREGHAEIVRQLIEEGADVNATTEGNWGPLHISYDFPEVARVLLENKADINKLSDAGTPLFLASRWDYPEVVKVYLAHKPDLEIGWEKEGYYDGMTALSIAVDQNNTECVKLLLEAGANMHSRTRNGRFPLLLALNNSFETDDTLRAVLEYNPSLTMTDDDGDTALTFLGMKTPVSSVKLLINAGADPEIANKKGYTALCIAAREGNLDVVKYLLSKNARINIIGARHGGPLHLACSFGSLEMVKILVENSVGADVNQACPGIWGTPLQCICYRPYAEDTPELINSLALYLIEERKADVNAYGGYFGYALSAACLKGTPDLIKLLLDRGVKVDVEDEMGRKPIHLASFRTVDHIDLLLDSGRLVAGEDKLKRTPLHYAVVSGRVDSVKRILDLAPELLDAPDTDGWTPLLWATRKCGKWNTTDDELSEIIELLLSRGADPWVRGEGLDREWSPLKVARYYGAGDKVVELLTPKSKERVKDGEIEIWDHRFHLSKKAVIRDDGFCDACLLILAGTYFVCQTCYDFCLCFKCYRSRDNLHPGHPFEEVGPEYDSEPETSPDRRVSIPYDDGATVLSVEEEDSDDESHEEEEEVTGEIHMHENLHNGVDGKDEEEEQEEDD